MFVINLDLATDVIMFTALAFVQDDRIHNVFGELKRNVRFHL